MKKLLYLFLGITFACSSGDESSGNNCDLDLASTKFDQLTGQMSYLDIENIIGQTGNNFRTDNLGTLGELKFYRWDFCDGVGLIECWIINDERLQLKTKNFADNSCSKNVNQLNYSLISIGDSYSQVSSLIDNQGDNIRVDYGAQGSPDVNFYRWYNCSNRSDYIEVWFDFNGEAYLINKSF